MKTITISIALLLSALAAPTFADTNNVNEQILLNANSDANAFVYVQEDH